VTDLDQSPPTHDENVAGRAAPVGIAIAAVAGLLFGGLTELGQTYLPDWLLGLTNSGAPWVLIAVGLTLLNRTPWTAVIAGTLALAGLEIGYVTLAELRHFPSAWTTVAFWLLAAAVFGPIAGLTAHFLRSGRREPWNAVGGGLVAGIVSGEGLAAYLTVRDTTSPAYWIVQMVVGVFLLAVVVRRSAFTWAVCAFIIGVVGILATRSVSIS
jgi:hypothetical protein